jgi:D-sedoheptulose 7-phosphate isomerase
MQQGLEALAIESMILQGAEDGIRAMEFLKKPESLIFIERAALAIVAAFQRGNKLLIVGNGGSLCDAMHFAEELTGRFRSNRKPLPAMVFSDPGHITCTANDFGYEEVFVRGVEAFGKPGDVLVLLSTSGNSKNLIRAADAAKEMGVATFAFLGKTGGELKGQCDAEWIVTGFQYADRIQEAHMTAIHIVLEIIEREMFPT